MTTTAEGAIEAAYDHCLARAHSHYENFPVASLLLPRRIRRPVAAVYAFARTADDLADEGELTAPERIAALDALGAALDRAVAGEPTTDPMLIATADAIHRHRLPVQLFHDLLTAFRQDATTRRYADFNEVRAYCRCSADPVGRLLLHLFEEASAENLRLSDRICSALQLINFLQDIAQDLEENDRIYLPQDEMARFGVSELDLAERRVTQPLRKLLAFQIERTRTMMLEGAPLGRRLPGRFGLEIRLIVEGGLAILDRLETDLADPFARPRLRSRDQLAMLFRALFLHRTTPP